jgi:alpha-tubulin suppressor-like RCC1 family protein
MSTRSQMRRVGVAGAAGLVLASLVGVSPATATVAAGPSAVAWGNNTFGQLGNGTTNQSPTPVLVSGLSGATAIASGGYHSLALRSDGTVWAWGANGHGQLGNGTTINSSTPVQANGLSGATAIAGGSSGDHSLAVKSDGTVWTWGANGHYQLGNGTTIDSSIPVQVSGLGAVTAVAGGSYHSLALKSDGTLWAWGDNTYGQLGNGTTIDSSIPVQVSGLSGVTAIAGGVSHSLAVKSDGTVWAWGWNALGQLGNGTTIDSSIPVQVSGLSGATAVAGGYGHSLAAKSDGTVWGWGFNFAGQIGNTSDTKTPVQVSGVSGATAVAAGYWHSLALKSDGTVWAWGYNDFGQLGNGSSNAGPTYIPVQVSGLFGATAVAAGTHHSLAIATSTGLLRVVSSPAVPTQISVDGNISDTWGLTWMKATVGPHTVCFAHVDGWTEPPCQNVTVDNGATTSVTGTFTQRGELRVMTLPAVNSQISVDGNPTNEFGVWTDIPTGSHTVCFGAVVGFNPPGCQTATVTAGTQTTISGIFTPNPLALGQSGVGLLHVATSPAVPAQITITPSGGGPYIADSWGLNWLELAPGSYTVSFNHVDGWAEPAPQTVTVTAGNTTTATGTFTQRGFLRVMTSPGVAGTISVDGNPTNDWGMWTDIPTGSHTVCFGPAPGYDNAPACQTTTVNAGVETDVTGTYS